MSTSTPNQNKKLITQLLIAFAFLILIPLAWHAITNQTPQGEIAEASSDIKLTTDELIVINEQEAKLLQLQKELSELENQLATTNHVITELRNGNCDYQNLDTCKPVLVFTNDNAEPTPLDPKAQGAR
jgi:septal ring factor EnvC (AmiA/AmiB activator)